MNSNQIIINTIRRITIALGEYKIPQTIINHINAQQTGTNRHKLQLYNRESRNCIIGNPEWKTKKNNKL